MADEIAENKVDNELREARKLLRAAKLGENYLWVFSLSFYIIQICDQLMELLKGWQCLVALSRE